MNQGEIVGKSFFQRSKARPIYQIQKRQEFSRYEYDSDGLDQEAQEFELKLSQKIGQLLVPTIQHTLIVKGKERGLKEIIQEKPQKFNEVFNQTKTTQKKAKSKVVGEDEIIAFKLEGKEEGSKYSKFIQKEVLNVEEISDAIDWEVGKQGVMDVVFLKIEEDTYLRAYELRNKAPMVLLDFYIKYSYLIK
ncbi:hypothetical protein pb186bvf_014497 [Paramecium bursaria]